MSPASRTISLGRASSASAAAAMTATNSMRHVSLNYPPRKSQEKDVFDRDDAVGRSHSASNSLSVPHTHSDMDDRSKTPPATPGKRLLELASNNTSPRQRLVSEPTSPRRLQMLRERTSNKGSEGAVNLSSPLRESTALSSPLHRGSPLSNTAGRSSTMNSPGSSSLRRTTTLGTVDEGGDKRSPATRKARTPIPFEFLATVSLNTVCFSSMLTSNREIQSFNPQKRTEVDNHHQDCTSLKAHLPLQAYMFQSLPNQVGRAKALAARYERHDGHDHQEFAILLIGPTINGSVSKWEMRVKRQV